MKPSVDDEHIDDLIKKLERVHHLAKNIPHMKPGIEGSSTQSRFALNSRYSGSSDIRGSS